MFILRSRQVKRERRDECLVQFNYERVRIRIMFTRTGAADDQGKRTVVERAVIDRVDMRE